MQAKSAVTRSIVCTVLLATIAACNQGGTERRAVTGGGSSVKGESANLSSTLGKPAGTDSATDTTTDGKGDGSYAGDDGKGGDAKGDDGSTTTDGGEGKGTADYDDEDDGYDGTDGGKGDLPTQTPTQTPTKGGTDTGTTTGTGTDTSTTVTPTPRDIGLAFEDWTDWDFNDVVLCFNGAYSTSGDALVSQMDQTLTINAFGASACQHRVDVRIDSALGTQLDAISYLSWERRTLAPISVPNGAHVKVTVTLLQGAICAATMAQPLTLGHPQRALIEYGRCRNYEDATH